MLQRMVDVLCDGMPHAKEELYACMADTFDPRAQTLAQYVYLINKKVKREGLVVVFVSRGRGGNYQMFRRLNSNHT